jgi:alginate O-acetyltransferase complex protein AlgI
VLFSSIPFLYYFLPVTLLLYALMPRRGKNALLLLASLFFYAWGEQALVLLFAASILLGWGLGLLIQRYQGRRLATALLWLSVGVNLAFLGYFKYADFFLSNLNALLGTELPLLGIALPIGISFYTFQILSYTVDVYRGTVPAQRNLIDFATYVSFFPQLIAGPIVRYADIRTQLRQRTHSLTKTAEGIRRFLLGLGKKVLIANVMGDLCQTFRATSDPSVLFYWLYAVAFFFQIYFDFSGYSDMAIGLGKVFGFELMENFRYPYCATSITEFWRRWHISLGTWFRDYVYIPLGGNRRGALCQLRNILVVWLLTGLWHGAAWNFVLWGLLFALLLLMEKNGLKRCLDRHPALGHAYVLLAVLLGFVLFNAADLAQAASDLGGLFAFGRLPLTSVEACYVLRSYAVPLLVAAVGATPLPKRWMETLGRTRWGSALLTVAEPVALTLLLVTATAYLVDGSFNPFLYFRF